jgi:hypothetical protein
MIPHALPVTIEHLNTTSTPRSPQKSVAMIPHALGVEVVFKCSMVTGSAWGIMATYFWGLLGVDGCIQMFGGVRTGLLLCVFPLFAYHN